MSPAATMTVDEARRAILASADESFYRRGIAAVTMARIRDDAGVSLRRLYSLYPTKADLVAGWLEDRHRSWMAWLEAEVATRTSQGVSSVDAVFDALAAWLESTDFRGCGFVNSLAETAEITAEHAAIIRSHKQALIDFLATITDQPESLAVVVDGAIVQAAVFLSTEPIEAARRAAVRLPTTEGT